MQSQSRSFLSSSRYRAYSLGIFSSVDLLRVESKWKERWLAQPDLYSLDEKAGKKYILAMFPYPSGKLHMGHVRVYTISDALARYQRLRGACTLHPMGWDAFGLPAENAAIERSIPPSEWTCSNINQMRTQLSSLSFKFDWDHEVTTCDKSYYRWTQWIFVRLYKRGLAYRKEGLVNWDPVDRTVLAAEQVNSTGHSWRSGALVEKRPLAQWYLSITTFQNELLDGLEQLGWPKSVKDMQRNWIVSSFNYHFSTRLEFYSGPLEGEGKGEGEEILVVTDNPDNWYFASGLQIGSEHPIALTTKDIGNARAIHPFASNVLLPIFIVPQDEIPSGVDKNSAVLIMDRSNRKVCKRPIPIKTSIKEYRLRDWLISRQRYWGTPIPIIYCSSCGPVPVPEEQLPVILPENVPFTGKGGSPLAQVESWVKTPCPSCGKMAERETDTMDTFMDSSWYFARYTDAKNEEKIFNPDLVSKWLPIDVYVGGIEHAILHLLYARFINRFLMEELKVEGRDEPFSALITQGIVSGLTYKCQETGRYLPPNEVSISGSNKSASITATGKPVTVDWEKMSKSKYNGIDPVDLVAKYGADTLRILILFKAPPEVPLCWNTVDIVGPQRWLVRLLNLYKRIISEKGHKPGKENSTERLTSVLNKAIKDLEFAYDPNHHRLNLAVSSLMKLTNEIEALSEGEGAADRSIIMKALNFLSLMLHPLAPHTSAELREMLGFSEEPLMWPTRITNNSL